MSVVIENENIRANINEHGAQLTSLYSKKNDLEYIWTGDEKYWLWHAPLLFPIEGKLKDGYCLMKNKRYSMPQHGFARDNDFTIEKESGSEVTLKLVSNPQTLQMFPFKFELLVTYTLNKNTLKTVYEVINKDKDKMYFTIGSHPGFNIPLVNNLKYEDYQLHLSSSGSQISLSKEGLIDLNKSEVRKNEVIPLTHELFKNDALIYKFDKKDVQISLKSNNNSHGIEVSSNNAKYWGIWSSYPKESNFVCIEPWWGITDTVDSNHEFSEKFGNNWLEANESYLADYSIKVF